MTQKREFTVQDIVINVVTHLNNDYISLTDLVKVPADEVTITQWLENRNTMDFLSLWELISNPDFDAAASDACKPSASISGVKEWSLRTKGKALLAKGGRYGGIYAHIDIALEFAAWRGPVFKLQVANAFHQLKSAESNVQQAEWNFRRTLAATNYRIHTAAVKEKLALGDEDEIYSEEAELINTALFGQTAREWRELAVDNAHYKNIRDAADTHQLIVLSNLESINALLIRRGIDKQERLNMMRETAVSQLSTLQRSHREPKAHH